MIFEFIETGSKVFIGIFCLYIIYKFVRSLRLVPTRVAYVVERLGKYHSTLGPGFHALLPFIDHVAFIQQLKEEAVTVTPQECFTRDNVKVKVDGVIYMSVTDPVKASYGITNYRFAAIQLAQTTTRSVIGTIELDKTFEERELINAKVIQVLGEIEESWGIKVHRYEVKNIDPSKSVREAMERQMTAERERRALVAKSEGQSQAIINDSEGQKTQMINSSEGVKQRTINEAEGKAQEIESLATATAESISNLARAISTSQGDKAIRHRLSQQLLTKFGSLAQKDTQVILPRDLTDFDSLLKGVDLKT